MPTAKELVALMTLEEKATLLSGADAWHTEAVERLGVKQVMVSDGPHGLRTVRDEKNRPGEAIPAVCFPAACATTASFDPALVRRMGEALGDECQHEEVAVNLGPAINIKRSPLCGRNFEYMSEDPYLAGELAVALVQGIQSRNIGTSVKHFACNDQEHRRLGSDSVVDERTLREIYLPAFEAAAKRGKAWTFMCSYNRVNGTLASENRRLLTEILREDWGYEGLVMSDWGAVSDRPKGVEAGLDLEMPGSHGINTAEIVKAVREGRLDEKYVDICAERVVALSLKYHATAKPDTPWDKEAHHRLAGELAAECMVLLKNEASVLPFSKTEKVAVIGAFAEKPRFQGGGSSHINPWHVTSLLEAVADLPHSYAAGYRLEDEASDEALLKEAVDTAKAADKVLVVAGLPDHFESEGYDRTHMGMPANQNELIAKVAEANPNTVVLLYNGSPVEMPWADRVAGIVEGYLAGQDVGEANRAVLWGEVNPSGRLPETFPLRLQDTPCYLTYGGEGDRTVYAEGVFVGYRYYTSKEMAVRFPFGHGLSYTTFAYGNLRLSADEITDQDTLEVCVDVTNTGKIAGKEVVQLYVHDRDARVKRPVRELKGFDKVYLEPGETKTVRFSLCKRAFAYWSVETDDWFVESGLFDIQICRSAQEVICEAPVTVKGTVKRPVVYTEDTILMDVALDPHATAVLYPFWQETMKGIWHRGEEEKELTVAEMQERFASMERRYNPIRNLISFARGRVTHAEVAEVLRRMNEA